VSHLGGSGLLEVAEFFEISRRGLLRLRRQSQSDSERRSAEKHFHDVPPRIIDCLGHAIIAQPYECVALLARQFVIARMRGAIAPRRGERCRRRMWAGGRERKFF
jgi:hypothetical protein